MAFAGGAILWQTGTIQPMLSQVMVFGYLAVVLLALAGVLAHTAYVDLQDQLFSHFADLSKLQEQIGNLDQVLIKKLKGLIYGTEEQDIVPGLANLSEDPFLTQTSKKGGGRAQRNYDVANDPFLTRVVIDANEGAAAEAAALRPAGDFAALLLSSYKTADEAWVALDTGKDGTVSCQEFIARANALKFQGDAAAVFKILDKGSKGFITRAQYNRLQRLHEEVARAQKEMEAAQGRAQTPAGLEDLARAIQAAAIKGVHDNFVHAAKVAYDTQMTQQLEVAIAASKLEDIRRLLEVGRKFFGCPDNLVPAAEAKLRSEAAGARKAQKKSASAGASARGAGARGSQDPPP